MNNDLKFVKETNKIIIALCDDNQTAVRQLEELVQEYLEKKKKRHLK